MGTSGSIGLWKVKGILKDPCTKGGPGAQWNAPGALNSLGPSVDDLAAGLASQTMLSPTTPVPVELGGHEGVYLEMTAPRLDYRKCSFSNVMFWTGEDGDTGPSTDTAGTKVGVWILDVDGTRAVLNTFTQPGITPDQAEALTAVAESARFTTTDGTPIP